MYEHHDLECRICYMSENLKSWMSSLLQFVCEHCDHGRSVLFCNSFENTSNMVAVFSFAFRLRPLRPWSQLYQINCKRAHCDHGRSVHKIIVKENTATMFAVFSNELQKRTLRPWSKENTATMVAVFTNKLQISTLRPWSQRSQTNCKREHCNHGRCVQKQISKKKKLQ